jgi:hypothetical protein
MSEALRLEENTRFFRSLSNDHCLLLTLLLILHRLRVVFVWLLFGRDFFKQIIESLIKLVGLLWFWISEFVK